MFVIFANPLLKSQIIFPRKLKAAIAAKLEM